MRRYEMALVADPQVPVEDHDKQLTVFEQLIADMGGVVHKVEHWGRRKLAYPIGKHHEGVYTLVLYDAAPEVEREFIRRVKLNDMFFRFLSVRADHQKAPTAEEKALFEQARKDYIVRAQERAAQGLADVVEEDVLAGPAAGPERERGERGERRGRDEAGFGDEDDDVPPTEKGEDQ